MRSNDLFGPAVEWDVSRILITVSVIMLQASAAWASQPAAGPADGPDMKRLAPAQLEALLTRIENDLSGVKSLFLDFEQEKHLSLLADVVRAKGVCLFVRPNIIRFEITEPFRSVLIAHDRTVAKFEYLDGNWQKLRLPSPDVVLMVTREIASWLKGTLRQQANLYEIAAFEGKKTVIVLTPRAEAMRKHIAAIELQLAEKGSAVATAVIREPGGDFTRIRFVRERRNVDLPDALFDTAGQTPAPLPAEPSPAKVAPGGG
jgi:outer membrane lipoprotein-sorting protein